MAAVVIVGVEPFLESGGPGRLGAIDTDVGPFVEQGAIEALDLAVDLRVVGADPVVPGTGGHDDVFEQIAPVGRAVVGHDLRPR